MADKSDVVQTAAEFFKQRAAGATPGGLAAILDKAADVPPEPGDELPEEFDVARFLTKS